MRRVEHPHGGHNQPSPAHGGRRPGSHRRADHGQADHSHAGHAHAHGAAKDVRFHKESGGEGGAHGRPNQQRLLAVILIGFVILVTEVVAGFLANSLVLLSDAAHVSTDVAAVALAYVAVRISERPPTSTKTYGYYRAETVAAFVNALALWVISAYFIWEGWQRLRSPPEVQGMIVAVIGGVGLLANIAMAWILHGGREHLNVRSAYLHVLSDALGSVAAVVAGVGVLFFDARWLDPAATLVVAVLILAWTWQLTRDTLHILLEGTPASVKPEDVRDTIVEVPGVLAVHDLHVWSLTTGVNNLSAHVRVDDPMKGPAIVRSIRDRLHHEHGLQHVTIEVETEESECIGCN